jgi:hypothetical protein
VQTLAITIFLVLTAIALLHAGWAFGVLWPATDVQSLINTVIGKPGMHVMPGTWLTMFVAVAIAVAGICALWGARLVELPLPAWMSTASVVVLALIFGLRGVASYLPGPLSSAVEPFATLDRRFYAPLCLIISAGFIVIHLYR